MTRSENLTDNQELKFRVLSEKLEALNLMYGGYPLSIRLLTENPRKKHPDIRQNDIDLRRVPLHKFELSAPSASYKLFHRAGHRLVAPVDRVIAESSRLLGYHLGKSYYAVLHSFLDKQHYNRSPLQYFSNMGLSVGFDLITNAIMPLLVDQPDRRAWKDGLLNYLQNAKCARNDNDANVLLEATKWVELRLMAELYARQFGAQGLPDLLAEVDPDEIPRYCRLVSMAQQQDVSLMEKLAHMLPAIFSLVIAEATRIQPPPPSSGRGSGQHPSQKQLSLDIFFLGVGGSSDSGSGFPQQDSQGNSSQDPDDGSSQPNDPASQSVLGGQSQPDQSRKDFGQGKKHFGPTWTDYFDPEYDPQDFSAAERQQVRKNLRMALNAIRDFVPDEERQSIFATAKNTGKLLDNLEDQRQMSLGTGLGAGSGWDEINRWEETPFYRHPRKTLQQNFSEVLGDALQRVQDHLAERRAPQERSGNRIWSAGDPPRHLRVLDSIQTAGILIPNVTTLMATYAEGQSQEGAGKANLCTIIDVSGSMGGCIKVALEAAIAAGLMAHHEGGRISYVAFESVGHEIYPPGRDIDEAISRLERLHSRGGTTLLAVLDLVIEHVLEMPCNLLLITDADIYDWTSREVQRKLDVIREHCQNFVVWQTFADMEHSKELLQNLEQRFADISFHLLDPSEGSFSDSVLKEMFP